MKSRIQELLDHCTYENALSYNDIINMTDVELENLISICWHETHGIYYNENTFRCDSDGLFNIEYTQELTRLEWEDNEGGASIYRYEDLNAKIHRLGDGEWDYGIYKPLPSI